MKKLLYTLLLGLLVVSCQDKYEESFEAPLLDVEIAAENQIDYTALENRLLRLIENADKMTPKTDDAARTAGGHVKLVSLIQSGSYYEFLFSDDISSCNEPTGSIVLFLVPNGANTEVRLNSETGTLLNTLTVDLSAVYALSFTEGLKVDLTTLAANVVAGSGTSSVTFTF